VNECKPLIPGSPLYAAFLNREFMEGQSKKRPPDADGGGGGGGHSIGGHGSMGGGGRAWRIMLATSSDAV